MDNQPDYQEQSAQDLRLHVIEGDLDLSQFQVFKTEMVRIVPGITVEAMIVGRSHVICFQVGPLKLYEVFACGDVRTPHRRAFYGPLREVTGSVQLSFSTEISYDFLAIAKGWLEGADEIRRMEAEIVGARGFYLSYDFPQRDHVEPARTIVSGSSDGPGAPIIIKTAHSYPNEETIVISHSGLLTRKDAKINEKEVSVAGHNHRDNGVVHGGLRWSAPGASGPSRRNS